MKKNKTLKWEIKDIVMDSNEAVKNIISVVSENS